MATDSSTKRPADILREQFKAAGFNARQVSIRHEYYSLGSSITVTVRDVRLPLKLAKRIAEGQERIHRCEYSGEILGGCNRYVEVRHDEATATLLANLHVEAVKVAIAEVRALPKDSRELRPIAGTRALLGWDDHRCSMRLWSQDSSGCVSPHLSPDDPARIAYRIATMAQDSTSEGGA